MPRVTAARRSAALGVLLLCVLGCAAEDPPRTGRWRAWLDSPGGELPFGVELASDGDGLRAWLINGPERVRIPQVTLEGRELLLEIDRYDSRIRAKLDATGTRLDGEWTRTSGPGRQTRLAFHAVAGDAPRFATTADHERTDLAATIDGRWSVQFEKEETPSVGELRVAKDGTVRGTFLNATGDYRYLAGVFDGGRLRLSTFDGAHAFLFDARLETDGSLRGDFWSRDVWHETWTAERDPDAEPVDAFDQTRWTGGRQLADLVYPDLDGEPRSLADPRFSGAARIVELFGSWCPNCNDAAEHLVELDRRYGERGLSIVGVAFEMTGDFERDAEHVRKYAAHHGIEFPLLIGGTSDKALASEAFPALDRVRAFPTLIFLDDRDRVRAVYSGYSGPATGAAYQRLRDQFETLIEQLLDEGAAPSS